MAGAVGAATCEETDAAGSVTGDARAAGEETASYPNTTGEAAGAVAGATTDDATNTTRQAVDAAAGVAAVAGDASGETPGT